MKGFDKREGFKAEPNRKHKKLVGEAGEGR